MQLDKTNFTQALPKVIASIRDCDLVSFDLEFSGLRFRHPYFPRTCPLDSNQSYFERWSIVAQHFTPLQIGITCYKGDVSKTYSQESFSFLLHPAGNKSALAQADSLTFLASHSFDFSRCYSQGIPYEQTKGELLDSVLRLEEQGVGHEWLAEVYTLLKNRDRTAAKLEAALKGTKYSKVVRSAALGLIQEIAAWADSTEPSEEQSAKKEFSISNPLASELLKGANFGKICERWGLEVSIDQSKVSCSKTSPGEKSAPKDWQSVEHSADYAQQDMIEPLNQYEKEAFMKSKKLEYLADKLGFSVVFLELARLKKPLIGHFCIFDLMYVYRSCYDNIPKSLETFCKELNEVFPLIYDTKVMVTAARIFDKKLQSGLTKLYTGFLENLPKGLKICEPINFAGDQSHDAGYDSAITGFCFIHLWAILSTKTNTPKLKSEHLSKLKQLPSGNELYLTPDRIISLTDPDLNGVDPEDHELSFCMKLDKSIADSPTEARVAFLSRLSEHLAETHTFVLHRVNQSNYFLELRDCEVADVPKVIAGLNEKFEGLCRFAPYEQPLVEDSDRFWYSRLGYV